MNKQRLLAIVEKFSRAHLLVVGDLMLDRFIWGDVERLSPEAPVPVLRVVAEDFRLGGAANVINNIRSLGARVTACGIIGNDSPGKKIAHAVKRTGSTAAGLFVDGKFQTIQKTRVIARPHHQQIVRLDRESRDNIDRATLARMRSFIFKQLDKCDGVIVSDYGKGTVHKELLAELASACRKRGLLCVVDPKRENYAEYKYPSLVTPNKDEASDASGIAINDQESLLAAGTRLLNRWQARAVLVTRGAEGMSLFRPKQTPVHFPTAPRDVFEVTGAGDTVVAACGLVLASGGNYEDAALIANLAAGFVGDEVGTVAVRQDRLVQHIKDRL